MQQALKNMSTLVRSMVSKLSCQELAVLEYMLIKPPQPSETKRIEQAKSIIRDMLPQHRTYLIDYKKSIITAFYGEHKPDKMCRTVLAHNDPFYPSKWYSADGGRFIHVNWAGFTFRRCTREEFGVFLLHRLGPRHITSHMFDYGRDNPEDDSDGIF